MRNKSYDEKMRAALREAWRREQEQLNKEVEDMGPHVFSEEFNQKMDKLLNEMAVKEKRGRRKDFIIRACAIVATFVLLVTGATTFATVNARASASGMNVIEWCEKYFVTKVIPKKEVAFNESCITYIPEGFDKVLEEKSSSGVYLKYENGEKYFILQVQNKTSLLEMDIEDSASNMGLNKNGFEYMVSEKTETKEYVVIWDDAEGNRYTLTSLLEQSENEKIMNGVVH